MRVTPMLRQTCSWPRPWAQYAFKDLMIHGILQFTLRIAFRCVLHRCESQDIRCWRLSLVFAYVMPISVTIIDVALDKFGLVLIGEKGGPTKLDLTSQGRGMQVAKPCTRILVKSGYAHNWQCKHHLLCAASIHTSFQECIGGSGQTVCVRGVVVNRFNDPSAGSPTETLLRLLLPLGGRV